MLCDARPGTLSAISPESPPAAGAIKEVVTPPYRDIGRSSSGLLQEKGLNMFRSSARRHAFVLSQIRAVSEGRCIFFLSSQQLLSPSSRVCVCMCVWITPTPLRPRLSILTPPFTCMPMHLCAVSLHLCGGTQNEREKKNRPVSPLPLPRTNLPSQQPPSTPVASILATRVYGSAIPGEERGEIQSIWKGKKKKEKKKRHKAADLRGGWYGYARPRLQRLSPPVKDSTAASYRAMQISGTRMHTRTRTRTHTSKKLA